MQRSGEPGGAIADRDAEVGPALVAAVAAAVARHVLRLLGVVDDGALLAVHPRRDRAVVVHPHRPRALHAEASRRHGAQEPPSTSSNTMMDARFAPTTVLTSRTIVRVASSSRTVCPRISLMA